MAFHVKGVHRKKKGIFLTFQPNLRIGSSFHRNAAGRLENFLLKSQKTNRNICLLSKKKCRGKSRQNYYHGVHTQKQKEYYEGPSFFYKKGELSKIGNAVLKIQR